MRRLITGKPEPGARGPDPSVAGIDPAWRDSTAALPADLGPAKSRDRQPDEPLGKVAPAVVGATGAPLLLGRHHGADRHRVLAPGTQLEVTDQDDHWCRIETGEGIPLYVHGSLVDIFIEDGDRTPDGYVRIHDQRPTYYHTAREAGFPVRGPLYGHHYDGTERREIRTPAGSLLAVTSGRYFALLLMQGSGILADGRGVTYVSSMRFQSMPDGCKGVTATGNWVVPFHTLAVNRREMPYHEVYFIPKSKGLVLPDGEVHDGFWFAHDTGGAFQGTPRHRIDLYVDRAAWVDWTESNLSPSFAPLEVQRVDRATRRRVYEQYRDQLGPSREPGESPVGSPAR